MNWTKISLLDMYYHSLSYLIPKTPLVNSKFLYKFLFEYFYLKKRKPNIGLFQWDNSLGWKNKANKASTHPSYEFRVTYTTDQYGYRITPNSSILTNSKNVYILGCSWSFGHGVENHQTFSWLIGEDSFNVKNLAVMGYGTNQAYLQFEGLLRKSITDSDLIIYAWMPEHLMRVWRRETWIKLNSWVSPDSPSHPLFDIENNKLVFKGLVGIEAALKTTNSNLNVVNNMEWRITLKFLSDMHTKTKEANAKFLVLLLPHRGTDYEKNCTQKMRLNLQTSGLNYLDLNDDFATIYNTSNSNKKLFYSFDGHPTIFWHKEVAIKLIDFLRNQ